MNIHLFTYYTHKQYPLYTEYRHIDGKKYIITEVKPKEHPVDERFHAGMQGYDVYGVEVPRQIEAKAKLGKLTEKTDE
jgi:hypothetical protein